MFTWYSSGIWDTGLSSLHLQAFKMWNVYSLWFKYSMCPVASLSASCLANPFHKNKVEKLSLPAPHPAKMIVWCINSQESSSDGFSVCWRALSESTSRQPRWHFHILINLPTAVQMLARQNLNVSDCFQNAWRGQNRFRWPQLKDDKIGMQPRALASSPETYWSESSICHRQGWMRAGLNIGCWIYSSMKAFSGPEKFHIQQFLADATRQHLCEMCRGVTAF